MHGFFYESTTREDELAMGRVLTDEDKADHTNPLFHIHPLDPTSTLTRGNSATGFIVPPPDVLTRSTPPSNDDFQRLVLRGMHQRTRGLMFDFTIAVLAVSVHPHNAACFAELLVNFLSLIRSISLPILWFRYTRKNSGHSPSLHGEPDSSLFC